MKIEDLMVGDWVFIKDYPMIAQPMQVKKEHFVRSLVEFHPIPLTPKILKKNGFKKNISNTKMCLDTYEYRLIYNLTNRLFTIFNEIEGVILVQKSIVTVHELQHILKHCGIDKEIVV